MQAPPIVRVRGAEAGSPEALRILDAFSGVIRTFVGAARQQQATSGLNHVRQMRDFGPIRVSYDRLFGRELIEVLPRPEFLRRVERPVEEVQEDFLLDGYISFSNVNRVPDDNLEIRLNGELLATLDFAADNEYTCYIFRFGKNGLRVPPYNDDVTLPEPPLVGCIPQRADPAEGQFSYITSYAESRAVIQNVFEIDDYGPLKLYDRNLITVTAVTDNGLGTYGEMTAEFYTRNPSKFRYVPRSWRYTNESGLIRVNDWTMTYQAYYQPTVNPSENEATVEHTYLDLRPEHAESYTYASFEHGEGS